MREAKVLPHPAGISAGLLTDAGSDDADRVLPIDKIAKGLPGLIQDLQLAVVEGGPHAIAWTHAGQVNTALLDFLRS